MHVNGFSLFSFPSLQITAIQYRFSGCHPGCKVQKKMSCPTWETTIHAGPGCILITHIGWLIHWARRPFTSLHFLTSPFFGWLLMFWSWYMVNLTFFFKLAARLWQKCFLHIMKTLRHRLKFLSLQKTFKIPLSRESSPSWSIVISSHTGKAVYVPPHICN